MDFALTTGDSADNQQRNETDWARTARGRTRSTPTAAPATRRLRATARPARRVPAEAARYTGVQDYNDYARAPTPTSTTPTTRGALRRLAVLPGPDGPRRAAVRGRRPRRPDYVATATTTAWCRATRPPTRLRGDRDRLLEGGRARTSSSDLRSAIAHHDARLSSNPLAARPRQGPLVPPDPRRQSSATPVQGALRAAHASQADGHGFGFVDPAETRPRTARPATTRGARARASLHRAGHRLRGRRRRDRPRTATSTTRSSTGWSAAPGRDRPRTAGRAVRPPRDQQPHHKCRTRRAAVHRHRRRPRARPEPGLRPRPARLAPIHLGEPSQRPPGDTTETLSELLLRYPHVIAYVAGHTHVNQVLPYPAAERQRRLLEHRDRRRGRLALAEPPARGDGQPRRHAVDLRHDPRPFAAATSAARARHRASSFDVDQLASINRVFAYNDPQKGGGTARAPRPTRTSSCWCATRAAHTRARRRDADVCARWCPRTSSARRRNRSTGRRWLFRSCDPPQQSRLPDRRHARRERPGARTRSGSVRVPTVVTGTPRRPPRGRRARSRSASPTFAGRALPSDYTGELRATTALGSRTATTTAAPAGCADPATTQDVKAFQRPGLPPTATTDCRIGAACLHSHYVQRAGSRRGRPREKVELAARDRERPSRWRP